MWRMRFHHHKSKTAPVHGNTLAVHRPTAKAKKRTDLHATHSRLSIEAFKHSERERGLERMIFMAGIEALTHHARRVIARALRR